MQSRRALALVLVAVCVLSAAIGSGITLLAKTGPQGPAGERGPEGPEGPEGSSENYFVEGEVSQLRSEVQDIQSELEDVAFEAEFPDEYRLEEVEGSIRDLEQRDSEFCRVLETYC